MAYYNFDKNTNKTKTIPNKQPRYKLFYTLKSARLRSARTPDTPIPLGRPLFTQGTFQFKPYFDRFGWSAFF